MPSKNVFSSRTQILSSVFDWNNSQNGRLLGFIGVLSTLLQGGYVRRAMVKTGELKMAQRGVLSSALSLVFMFSLPYITQTSAKYTWGIRFLYVAAAFLAFTSATVVNSLTSLASLQCDDDVQGEGEKKKDTVPQLSKGRALGEFRSSGQLGRALGPLLGKYLHYHQRSTWLTLFCTACASYWTAGKNYSFLVFEPRLTLYPGPSVTYGVSAVLMFALASQMRAVGKVKVRKPTQTRRKRALIIF